MAVTSFEMFVNFNQNTRCQVWKDLKFIASAPSSYTVSWITHDNQSLDIPSRTRSLLGVSSLQVLESNIFVPYLSLIPFHMLCPFRIYDVNWMLKVTRLLRSSLLPPIIILSLLFSNIIYFENVNCNHAVRRLYF